MASNEKVGWRATLAGLLFIVGYLGLRTLQMPPKVRKYVRKLKQDFPLRKPVRIRTFADKPAYFGWATDKGDYYEIWLSRDLDDSVMVDTLWHEWCHLLLWPKCSVNHTDLFFKTYAKVYRHYLDGPRTATTPASGGHTALCG